MPTHGHNSPVWRATFNNWFKLRDARRAAKKLRRFRAYRLEHGIPLDLPKMTRGRCVPAVTHNQSE